MAARPIAEILILVGVAVLGYVYGPSISLFSPSGVSSGGLNIAPFIFSLFIGILVWIILDTIVAFDRDRSSIRAPKFLGGGRIHLAFIPACIFVYVYAMYLNFLNSQGSIIGFQNDALNVGRFIGFAWALLIVNPGVSAAGILFGLIFSAFIDSSMK